MVEKKNGTFLLLIISGLSYVFLGYFTSRNNFYLLLFNYSIVFLSFLWVLKFPNKNLFFAGITFRVILLLVVPFLSQDYFRFIWDGRLLLENISPFVYTPNQLIINENIKIADKHELFKGMGALSNDNYSNYPPLNQLIFFITSFFFKDTIFGSIVLLRICIILADIGIYVYGKKILNILSLNPDRIYIYFLNPLIIIELTGNLHFEGVMIFFFCLSIYFILKQKNVTSAIMFAFSILTKLLPLLVLPLLISYLSNKKLVKYYFIVAIVVIFGFLPFLSQELITNYSKTVGLWFTKFEFNASLYYLLRSIGYFFTGYNMISFFGKLAPVTYFICVIYLIFKNKTFDSIKILNAMLICLSIYFFFSTTVHPWYIATLVFLCIFTKFNFPIVWSFTVIFSYSAYSNLVFEENSIWLFAEYLPLFLLIFIEVFKQKKNSLFL